MANNAKNKTGNAEAYKLYKIAVWLRDNQEFQIPKWSLPENALSDKFCVAASAFASEMYPADMIKAIQGNAGGNPELAVAMLKHFNPQLPETKLGSRVIEQQAAAALQQIQHGENTSPSAQPE